VPSVLFVCLGNICRSPMALGIARKFAREHGLDVVLDSAGTIGHHVGESPDPRTRSVLVKYGAAVEHRGRLITSEDFRDFDLILAMDATNLQDLTARCPANHRHKLHMMLEPVGGGDVPDPYWGGPAGFEQVYQMLEPAVRAWMGDGAS
jgi:protein-tyrosine phosphatase